MALTLIDTSQLPKTKTAGEVTEVMNRALCGAENVLGSLRWLKSGQRLKAESSDKHQLIYLMEGQGKIHLDNKNYDVAKGAGVSRPVRKRDHPGGGRRFDEAVSLSGSTNSRIKRNSKEVLMTNDVSRRNFLVSAGAATLVSRLAAATIEDKQKLPVVPKRLEKAFKAPGKQPNDLQAASDGLWILDQVDPNKVFKVRWEDGSVISEIQTESIHGSGITYGNGALWIASTWGLKTLKVDPKTGKTLASFDEPGAGMPKFGKPTRPSGAHGLKWVDGKMWMVMPPSEVIHLIEPETGAVIRSIPGPGIRTHGIAWDNGYLWVAETIDRAIYKLDPKDGRPLAKIQLTKEDPEIHGLDLWKGVFWYSDASSGWVCRLV